MKCLLMITHDRAFHDCLKLSLVCEYVASYVRYAWSEIVMSLNFLGCRAAIIPIRDEQPTIRGRWRNNLRARSHATSMHAY